MAKLKTKRNCLIFLTVAISTFALNNISFMWNQMMVIYHWSTMKPLKMSNVLNEVYDTYDTDTQGFDDSSECGKPLMNIAFIKTHKTGGSTVTSILNRLADVNELQIALPVKEIRFDWPNQFTKSKVDHTRLKDGEASVLCNHLVFDKEEIDLVMKKPFKLVTIIRDPAYQFRSLFYYHNMHELYHFNRTSDPISHFFRNPSLYFRQKNENGGEFVYNSELLMKNGMTYDLNYRLFFKRYKRHSFKHFIDFIDRTFDLVMITEYFDESLILLKRMMCWNYTNILYKSKLVNLEIEEQKLSKENRKIIYDWNNMDFQLYVHFKSKLEGLIKDQNEKSFKEELYNFRKLNRMVLEYCSNKNRNSLRKTKAFLRKIKDRPESINENFCIKLEREEKKYVEYFREKYKPYYFIREK